MDAFSAFGSLIISEGATAPVVVAPAAPVSAEVVVADPTPEQQQAADAVFMNQQSGSEQNPAVPFFVITAAAFALKGVAIDEAGRRLEEKREDQDEEPARPRPAPNPIPTV